MDVNSPVNDQTILTKLDSDGTCNYIVFSVHRVGDRVASSSLDSEGMSEVMHI